MLSSISQVNEEFFRLFQGLTIKRKAKDVTLNVRYAKMSSDDYSEEQEKQTYPCIAIQDYVPTPKQEWYIDMRPYLGGISEDGLKGFLYNRPVWMEFRYDVSTATKSYYENIALRDLFLSKFQTNTRFLFNKKLSGDDEVGDIVPYTVRPTDIPRNDGVFETNYEFTLSVWLYAREPKEVELIQEVVIRLHQKELS